VRGLTVFKLHDTLRGVPIRSLEDVIDRESSVGVRARTLGPIQFEGFEAALFYASDAPREPEWASFLRLGFGNEVRFSRSASAAAAIVVRTRARNRPVQLAFVFGMGRYLLKERAIQRNFGFRVALNLMYEGDLSGVTLDPSRIRSVDAKRVDRTTVRSRRQSTSRTTLETFDLDLDRDLLDGITGEPADPAVWGPRITGSDSLHLQREIEFPDLGKISRDVVKAFHRTDYRRRFSWIDDVSVVRDSERVGSLEDQILQMLKSRSVQGLGLAVPTLVDWQKTVKFVFPGDRRTREPVTHPELNIESLLNSLSNRGLLEELTTEYLKTAKIESLDVGNERVDSWSVWRCLTGEIRIGEADYLLDNGEFYEVNPDYARALDLFLINNVQDANVSLPEARRWMVEAEYNRLAAEADSGLLLMDRATVIARHGTTPVEVCDLLSRDGHLIHIKRKLGSQALSHLFAQGYVSAELLVSDNDFRRGAATRVSEIAGDRAAEFPRLDGAVRPPMEVVYGVIAQWFSNDSIASRLPFFSKVNLRRHVQELIGRGFAVSFARIHLESL